LDNPNTNEAIGSPPAPAAAVPDSAAAPAAPQQSPTLGEWFKRNGPSLVILAALFVFLYLKFDADGLWSIVKAALGLGLVIFIHELGHFAVAKWCDVHVETFSIGFGPALPGCKWVKGETTYMIALFPLGGYVKMVGEGAGSEEGDEDPRSFKNKSVWQRMAIISAGVIMNVILAFVCFIVVFRVQGRSQIPGVAGMVEPGSPAWVQGIPAGAWIHRIGNVEDPYFNDLLPVVMNSGPGEKLDLVYSVPPSTESHDIKIVARKEKTDPKPVIGVFPASRTRLVRQKDLKDRKHPVYFSSAAAKAEPPFEFEDEIIGCTDPGRRKKESPGDDWTPLPRDVRNTQEDQPDFFELSRRLQILAAEDVTIRVRRKSGTEVSIRVPKAYHATFGLRMQMGQVAAVRIGSPAEGKARPARPDQGVQGDIIEQVEVTGPDGLKRFVFPSKESAHPKMPGSEIDPFRLHFELRQWARSCDEAARKTGKKIPKVVVLKVRRHNTQRGGAEFTAETLTLVWDDSPVWMTAEDTPYTLSSPTTLAELGIAFRITTTVSSIDPRSLASRYLRPGDVIKRIRSWRRIKDHTEEAEPLDLEHDQWPCIMWTLQSADVKKLTLQIERDQEEIVLEAREDTSWPLADRGLVFSLDKRMKRADSMGEALAMGLSDTWAFIVQIYQHLQGMIVGRISVKNLGGPIKIAQIAYSFAGENFWEFVFFLGLISINLAVVNFLPIPILDGGHMVFLIYEKIRGKPASERVLTVATLIGLLVIITLFVFVTFLDLGIIGR
jgi:regulator of sigma E protease